jgi:hypothetical protein
MAADARSQDPDAGDLARLPEVRHYSRAAVDEFRTADDIGADPGVYCLGVAKF